LYRSFLRFFSCKRLMDCSAVAAFVFVIQAQAQTQTQTPDPLLKPQSASVSVGTYQYGATMLKLDRAWDLTKGRAHIAMVDVGAQFTHPDLQGGINGNLRVHRSALYNGGLGGGGNHHGLLVAGVLAARGFNGVGVSGACPWCSLTIHEPANGRDFLTEAMSNAIKSGAVAINVSLGAGLLESEGNAPSSCDSADRDQDSCNSLARAAQRDIVVVSIAQNQGNLGGKVQNGIPFPANYPNVIAVGGVEQDGKFWRSGYDVSNPGSNWGPKLRLVTPAKDILTTHPLGKYLYDFKALRCGERVDSTVSEEPTLPASYSGYGDCTGTSFSAPWVTAIVGLMRSANPLLTASEVQSILYDTATQPVSGPDGLAFYVPNAEAAVQRALGGNSKNRLTPMFATYARGLEKHLFTTSPQMAVVSIAGELGGSAFASVGQIVSAYPQFSGKICASGNPICTQPDAKALFQIFTTEQSPIAGAVLNPLYRLSFVCNAGQALCDGRPQFAYATTEAQVKTFETQGYQIDVVEGHVFGANQAQPAGTLQLCQGNDAQRKDVILYAAAACNLTQLVLPGGETTGGNYQSSTVIGYVYALTNDTITPKSGWWWNASESGRGFFLEKRGNTLFIAAYYYEPDGRATWFTAAGAMTGNTFEAVANTLRGGQTLEGNYRAPGATTSIGTVSINFSANGASTMRWPGGTTPLSTFIYGGAGTMAAESGWWWNAAESGRGFSIEVQGNTLFMVGFLYDDTGNPIWVLTSGVMQSATRYTGRLSNVTGGQALNAPYRAPTGSVDIGSISVDLAGTDRATLTLPSGKQVLITRFRF
jgi:serine protease